jgi:hypothetical protein
MEQQTINLRRDNPKIEDKNQLQDQGGKRERERDMKPAKKMTCGGSHDEHEVKLGLQRSFDLTKRGKR